MDRHENRERRLRTLVFLNKVPGLGPVRIRAIEEAFGDLEKAWRLGENELTGVRGIGGSIARAFLETRDRFDPKAEIERVRSLGIRFLMTDSEDYPPLLREIHDPPPLLYVRGSLPAGEHAFVAVVGTRRCSHYGRMQAERLAGALARAGMVVVSGMARGIDTAAHRAALSAGGPTVAVLGSGLDRPYPPENAPLMEEAVCNGAVFSEFPLGTSPLPTHFPRRNRIISGMSLGVVVVEASLKSGSLITARFAADQDREVFAVPGKIDTVRSTGTHALIKEGAKLVESVEDVLEEFLPVVAKRLQPARPPSAVAEGPYRAILEALDTDPVGIEDVIEKTNMPAEDVAGALLVLELRRLVRQFPGKRFSRL